jgi:hypothetical protein
LVSRHIERYILEDCPGGVALKMRPAFSALAMAFIASAVLGVSWFMGPFGPNHGSFGGSFYWIWSGFFAVVVAFSLLGALRREDWVITRHETTLTTSFAGWRKSRRIARTRALGIRVEFSTGMGDDGAMFPWRLDVLNDGTRDASGLHVLFQRRRSVDQFLDALREVLPVDVDEKTAPRG